MPVNSTFSVFVRKLGTQDWSPVKSLRVLTGHQVGDGYSARDLGPGDGRIASSLALFDFVGTVEVKVVLNAAPINSFDLRPKSYRVVATREGAQTLLFSLSQSEAAPRKVVLRVNDSWDAQVLHIMTNPIEKNAPSISAANVHVVKPGDLAPRELPPGKDTYYFSPGLHYLPKGLWAEIDLGTSIALDQFELEQATGSNFFALGHQRFLIETKNSESDAYAIAYDGTGNTASGMVRSRFSRAPLIARFVRLTLLGNNAGSHYFASNFVTEFRLFDAQRSKNYAAGRAVAGALNSYAMLVDGSASTAFASKLYAANWHSGESFILNKSGVNVYLAPGSLLKGSILSEEQSKISIRGRGILDLSDSVVRTHTLLEGRTGAISLTSGTDLLVEGITILDAPMWTVVLNHNVRPIVRHVNIFGSTTNADGIHMSGSSEGLAEGNFIRTCDDSLVMYHYGEGKNNLFKNNVVFSDGARPVMLGLGDTVGNIHDIVFDGLDVLNQQGVWDLNTSTGVLHLVATGGNEINNITFRNIRIDSFRHPDIATLFMLRNNDASLGKGINNIVFESVAYVGNGELRSVINGVSGVGSYGIREIAFVKVTKNGVMLQQANQNDFLSSVGAVFGVTFGPKPATNYVQGGAQYPLGLFRFGTSGNIGKGTTYCSLSSSEIMKSCGYTQANYDSAPLLDRATVKATLSGACVCP